MDDTYWASEAKECQPEAALMRQLFEGNLGQSSHIEEGVAPLRRQDMAA